MHTLKESVSQSQKEFSISKKEKCQAESTLQEVCGKLTTLQSDKANFSSQQAQSNSLLANSQIKILDCETQIKSLTSKLSTAHASLASQKSKLDVKSKALATATLDHKNFQASRQNLDASNSSEISHKISIIKDLEAKNEKAINDLASLTKKSKDYEFLMMDLKRKQTKMTNEAKGHGNKMGLLRNDCESMERAIEEARGRYDGLCI